MAKRTKKKCPKCPRLFLKRGAWQKHMKRDHGEVQKWA